MSAPYIDALLHDPIVTLTKPLIGLQGEFRGVIAADISFTSLNMIFDNMKINLAGFIVDN